jgi:hypothetical protein
LLPPLFKCYLINPIKNIVHSSHWQDVFSVLASYFS